MPTLSYADQKELSILLDQYKQAFNTLDLASMRQLEQDATHWQALHTALTPLRRRYNFALGWIDGIQLIPNKSGNGTYLDGYDAGHVAATDTPTTASIRRIIAHFRRLDNQYATYYRGFDAHEVNSSAIAATNYAIRKAARTLRDGGIDSNYSYFRTLENLISAYVNRS